MTGVALESDGAVVLGENALNDRKAKAGAVGLGCEERIENAAEMLLRDALAGIVNSHGNVRALPGGRH